MSLTIRVANVDDHATTRALVDVAFRPEDVASFLDGIREEHCIIGEWLADDQGEVLGHIVFSRVWLETEHGDRLAAAMLSPLAVHPDYQRQGIGTKLMANSLHALERNGEQIFYVLGHPQYYPRVGFSAQAAANTSSPWQGNPAFMARTTSALAGRLILPRTIVEYG